MAYGRCAIYDYTGDGDELADKARAGVLPILQGLSGFISYGAIVKDGHVVSMSAWESEADARAGDQAAKQWVGENDMSMTLKDTYFGEFAWLEFAQQ